MAETFESSVQALTRALTAVLGDNLVSLVLYGSAARGGWVEGRSDVNVLLIVRDASAASLGKAAPALKDWALYAHAAPLIQTERDWDASADVFPIEIEDMRAAHRLLAGKDPFAGVTTERADLRAQLEREARGKLIRLRAEYAASAADGKQLGALLARATPTFVVLFRGGLLLAGRPVPAEAIAAVAAMAQVAGFDGAAFDWALGARASGKAALQPYDATAAAYLGAVEQFVNWVDRA